MTQKLKKISIISLLLSAFVIFSCSEDYEVHDHLHNHENSKFKFKKITLNDIQHEKNVVDKINNASKISGIKKNNLNKIVSDTINNFFIDTEQGLLIESENYTSYTFKVFRTNGSSFLLENLVISKEGNKDYETYLYQYDITQQELDLINQSVSIDLSNKISRVTLENSNLPTDILNKEDYNGMCFVETTTYTPGQRCNQPGKHSWEDVLAGAECTVFGTSYGPWPGSYTTTATLQPCPTGGGGDASGGSGSSSSSGGSSYSGGSGGTGGVTTSPVNNCKTCIPPYIPDPCDKVKNLLLLNPDITTKLQELSTKTTDTIEQGAFLLNNGSGVQNATVSSAGEIAFDIPTNGILIFMAHTHNSPSNSTYSVFSWEDLVEIANFLKEGKIDANQFVTFLITADGTSYAFTIDDTNAFLSFFAKKNDPLYTFANSIKNATTMYKYYGHNNGIDNTIPDALIKVENTDLVEDEKNFLNIIKSNKIGITLFEVDNTFTNFEKVKLNFFNSITKQPCN